MSLTRSEIIRAVWRTNVWANSTIRALTDKLIESDIGEASLHEVARLRYETKINFFAFRCTRSIEPQIGGKYRLFFSVDITYTKWADPDGANYNSVLDGIEILQEIVISQLGSNWAGTVASYEAQAGPAEVRTITIDNDVCYSADYSYTGMVCISE